MPYFYSFCLTVVRVTQKNVRKAENDRHEIKRIIFFKSPLECYRNNFGYLPYRASLARYETSQII